MKKHSMKLNNKAFSLVEILLAVGLLMIVSIAIGSIIVSTQNNASQLFSESELQQQLVEVQKTIHDELLSTNEGIKYWTKADKQDTFALTDTDTGGEYEKLIAFYNLDREDYVLIKTYYLYNTSKRTLQVATLKQDVEKNKDESFDLEVDNNIEASLAFVEKWTLVASNVKDLSLNVASYQKNKLISFSLTIEQGNAVYPADDTVYIRNDISINSILHIDKFRIVLIPKPTIENTAFLYDKAEHAPTELNYLDRYVSKSEFSVCSASQAGTYSITYQLKDKENTCWEDGSTDDVVYTWTISQRMIDVIWGTTTWEYDGETHSTTCTVSNVLEGDVCNVTIENNLVGPELGTTECTAKIDNTNYELRNPKIILVIETTTASVDIQTVNKTVQMQQWVAVEQSMVSYTNLIGGTLKFYISTDPTTPSLDMVNSDTCMAADAGTYYIWYRIESTHDAYTSTGVMYLGFAEMYKAKCATVTANNKIFNGEEQTGVTGTYVNCTGEVWGTNAGSYTAYATPDKNHLWPDGTDTPKTVIWNIAKADSEFIPPEKIEGLIYDATSQELVTAGSSTHGDVYYRIVSNTYNTSYDKSLPTAIDAGSYMVYYYLLGDKNHNSTEEQSFEVTIARRPTARASVTDKEYNGSPQRGVDGEFVTWKTGSIFEATNVGTYKAYATPDSNHAWPGGSIEEKELTWSITVVEGTITAPTKIEGLVYNKTAQVLVNDGYVNYGDIYYKIVSEKYNTEYSTVLPTATDAGTYRVYYYSSGDINHLPTDESYIDVTIKRAPIAVAYANNKPFNGYSQTGITGLYVTCTDGVWGTDVGKYTAYATPEANYAWSDESYGKKELVWYITKAAGSITAPTKKTNLIYDATYQELVNEGSTLYGDVYYKIVSEKYNTEYSKDIPTAIDAGTYFVYYYSDGDNNHNATAENYIEVTIERRRTARASASDKDYNGSPQRGVNGEFVTWKAGSVFEATNVGTYKAYATPDSNHAWSDGSYDEEELVWHIQIADGVTTLPTAKNLTFNDLQQTLLNTPVIKGGTMYYKLEGESSYSTTIPTAKNAGTYKVYYYYNGNGNYTNISESAIYVTIKRAPIANAYGVDVIFNKNSQTGVYGRYVTCTGEVWGTDAKTYTAYATPEDNYAWEDGTYGQKPITWTIKPLKAAKTWTDDTLVFNSDLQIGAYGEHVTWSNGECSGINAGEYSVWAKPEKNYAWEDGTTDAKEVRFEIAKAKLATVKGSTVKYSGSAQTGVSGLYVKLSGAHIYATLPNTYTVSATPVENYAWADTGTDETRPVTWTIEGYEFAKEQTVKIKPGSYLYTSSSKAIAHNTASKQLPDDGAVYTATIVKIYKSSTDVSSTTVSTANSTTHSVYVKVIYRNGVSYEGDAYLNLEDIYK